MRINKKHIAYVVLLLFFLYGLDNFVFERIFFLNEFLALVGFILFVQKSFFQRKGVFIVPNSIIYKTIFLFIILGVVHLFISLFRLSNFYYFFRNSVIVYSMFSFFTGFYLFSYLKSFLSKIIPSLWIFIIYSLIFPSIWLLERFMGSAFFPYLFKRATFLNYIVIFTLNIILAIRYESLTVILVTFIVISIILIKNYAYFKVLSLFVVLISIFVFIYSIPSLQKYNKGSYSLFGDIKIVVQDNILLRVDGNSTWRAVFWYRLIVERFPENIVGIGIGTPLLDYVKIPEIKTTPSDFDDEHDIHVTGGHNTYLTLTVRLGMLFLIGLVLIYREIFKEYFKYRIYYYNRNLLLLFLSFISVSVIGLFNLVLETPTNASIYWVILGFVSKAIFERRYSQLHNSMY